MFTHEYFNDMLTSEQARGHNKKLSDGKDGDHRPVQSDTGKVLQ